MKTFYAVIAGVYDGGPSGLAVLKAHNQLEAFGQLQKLIREYHDSHLAKNNKDLLSIEAPSTDDLKRITEVPVTGEIILDGDY